MPENRQLAAILFSDIVGYTSMMEQNEANTLEIVRKNREIQQPLVKKHHGKWLKEMGDGAMAQFKSALDAVKCAIEIQEVAKTELNARLRIGIHLGDITIEGDEIYGDGINVASRIETIAVPGTVFISEAVHGAIKGVDNIHTQFLGERKLKNVDGPVRIYKVVPGAVSQSITRRLLVKYLVPALIILFMVFLGIWHFTGSNFNKPTKTILVLPFEISTVDSVNQIFGNWVRQEIVNHLGKINSLSVINNGTSGLFLASVNPLRDAIERLDKTDYFAKGSLQKDRNWITVDMKLFDHNESETWSKSYTFDHTELPKLAGKIAVDISESINIKLAPDQFKRMTEVEPFDLEIHKMWLRAYQEIKKSTPESLQNARRILNDMVDQKPADARIWAMFALGLRRMGMKTSAFDQGIWREVRLAAERALDLYSLNASAWASLAVSINYGEQDFNAAKYAYDKANTLNPNMAWEHFHYAWFLYMYDRLDEAIIEHTIAQELDPLMPMQTRWLGFLYAEKGDYEQAMAEARRCLRIQNDYQGAYVLMGQVYLKKGQYDSAIFYFEKTKSNMSKAIAQFRNGEFEKGMERIRYIESKTINPARAFYLAQLYAEIDSLDKFFEYANYEPRHIDAIYFRKWVENPKVINDPRFKQLMDKMGLPMPKGYETNQN